MLIPHANALRPSTAPIPRGHAVRHARRLQAMRRWGRTGTVATVLLPQFKDGKPSFPSTSPLRKDEALALVEMAKAVHARGWISSEGLAALRGKDPSVIQQSLFDALHRHIEGLVAPFSRSLGGAPIRHSIVAHIEGIPGQDIHEGFSLFLASSPCIAFPALSEADSVALIHAWNAAAKHIAMLVRVEHTPDQLSGWLMEEMRDAANCGRWEGDQFVIDPSELVDHADNRGADLDTFIAEVKRFATDELRLGTLIRQPPPKTDSLSEPVGRVVKALRRLAALTKNLPKFPPIEEGPWLALSLSPPEDIHGDLITNGLDQLGNGEDAPRITAENVGQLLDHYVACSIHLAAAHAAFSMVLSLHDDDQPRSEDHGQPA